MGGGSSIGRSSLGNIKELERKAREELEKGARRNTFLSFDYDDIDEVNLLRAHAKNEKSEIEFIDRSVKDPINSERADYIKTKIIERIKQCSQTVVYITDKTHCSDWVRWEVEKSLELGREVIAVHKGDKPPTKIPSCIKDNKIKVLPWKKLSDHI
ncbi:TIR domain-containing protein [candidate division KSB1 bacterium]|nr:TIR domain-containing protein [candidate division KSB1 bacterium]